MLTQIMHVNFSSMTAPHLISVVQGDTGRNLKCIVDDFTLDGAWTATWYVERPSDVPVYNTATIETSDNSVNIELTAQSIAEVGDNKLQVRILDADDQVVTSFACILAVKPFGGIDAVESTTESNIFDKQVEEAKEEIDTALDEHLENGIFPSMTAGDIISDTYAENKVPYFFRPSGGGAEVGTIEAPVLVGGSVGWNQLANGIWQITGGTKAENADGSCTFTASASGQQIYNADIQVTTPHKYLASVDFKTTSATTDVGLRVLGINYYGTATTNWQTRNVIVNCYSSGGASIGVVDSRSSGWDAIDVKNFKLIDLTLLLGSTIADRIYTLEQSTAGSGIAQLRAWGFDFDDYIPYCAPTLRHVEGVSEHRFAGFNQWDEEWQNGYYNTSGVFVPNSNYFASKNLIPVISNALYHFHATGNFGRICWYNSEGAYISSGTPSASDFNLYAPSNARYASFDMQGAYGNTYKNDICINLSDSAKNGTYEPYRTWSYVLDGSVIIRGVPKLDANNSLYYDGDTYEPDGTVTHNCAVRAYQSGDESLADAITDGTNTVYKLSTPTTETAEPYTQYQEVDASGTEEYVSTGVVPVGHTTKYPTDLKGTFEAILSAIPSANGTYALKVTVANGKRTFSWV